MNIPEYLKSIGLDFREEKGEAWINLEVRNLHDVLAHLKQNGLSRLSAISGVDVGKDIELIYHVFSDSYYVNIRVSLPKKKLEIKTVTGIYPGANLFEREVAEMLGVNVLGHPNLQGLFLNENSPKNPLRKDSEEKK
ncbi:MAG: NADH-quinone oxidoreductase subunit C [Candidatus Aenigmarchaeota archaeon]|nr:NADH-quinone oxidoreductase subunit C [Candidatus Aenigmarchaeota archaeon]